MTLLEEYFDEPSYEYTNAVDRQTGELVLLHEMSNTKDLVEKDKITVT